MIMFRQRTIRRKLMLVLFIAALLAFAAASAAFVLFEQLTLENRARQVMAPYAQLVSVGAEAAVAFEDSTRAQEILDTLRATPQILEAQINLGDNRVLARYSIRSTAKMSHYPIKSDGVYVHMDRNAVVLVQNLRDGAHLYLTMNLDEINRQTRNTLLVFAVGMAVLLGGVTVGLLAALQQAIVRPISTLAKTVEQVHSRADYHQRVPTTGTDEVARLGQSFNAMMGALQKHEDAQRHHKDQLEKTVQQRTAELLSARDEAEAANRAKSTFLANMSHELRSPLNTLLGFARLMQRQPALPCETREDLAIILRSGEHLRTLINQVLDLAKIEAGRAALNETDFALQTLLDELEEMFAFKAEDRGLALHVEQQVPPFVRGDALKLRQVLINLLDNALKFTRQGSVTMRIARFDAPAGPRLHFAVTDTGLGIAAEELHDLFNPFVQTRTGQQTLEGTGLGLTISRNFVRLMGGTLHIESQVGRGTTVSFDLPLQAVEAVAMAPPPDRTERRVIALAPGQPRYRILAADDRQEARQLLLRLLTPLGFEVREAANGQEAVEIWEAWQPHLIWMDMRMPVLDGRAATRRIKARANGPATVIIALTASSFEEARAEILAAGCDDFLRKPFQEADLFGLMQKHLGVRFVYQNDGAVAACSAVPVDIAALTALPAALRHTLEQALIRLDTAAVTAALDAVPDAPLAHALAMLANEFQYKRMLHLIRDSDRKEST